MAKRFKLRILSRVIPSVQSYRSKDPSNLPADPIPSFLRLSPSPIHVDFPPATPPPSKAHRSSLKRHLSPAFLSIGFDFGSNSGDDCSESPEFKWQKEEKWHVVAKVYDDTPRQKIYYSSASGHSNDELFPPPPPPTVDKKKRRSKNRKKTAVLSISTSSAESGLFSLFSSEGADVRDEEETETLVSSSRSFSTDSSSEFNPHKKKKVRSAKGSPSKGGGNVGKVKIMCRSSVSSPERDSPARLSMFKKLIPCPVDGKLTESFAVVKKSEDPYEDFKRSMMEMILEKQIFEEKDLNQLLQCFLSLNSRHHHSVIVEAFTEIWEAMFCTKTSTDQRVSKAL